MIPKRIRYDGTGDGESDAADISRRQILKTSAGLSTIGLAGCEENSSDDSVPDEEQRQLGEGVCKNQYEQPGGTCNTDYPVYLMQKEAEERAEFAGCTIGVAGASFIIALLTPAAAASIGSAKIVSLGVKANEKLLRKGLRVCANEYGEMKEAQQAVKEEIKSRKGV